MEQHGGIRQYAVRIFYVLCLLTVGVMFINAILSNKWVRLYTALIMLAMAAVAVLLYKLYVRFHTVTDRQFAFVLILTTMLTMLLQVFISYYLQVRPSWDFGGVFISAREYVYEGRIITHEHYFERFPNNNGILMLEILFFKLIHKLGFGIQVYHGIALNIIFINAAVIFMVLFCRKMWGNTKALLFLVISFFFLPYLLYTPIFYTDTLSMVFVSAPLYLFACYLKQETTAGKVLIPIAMGLLLSFGVKVKGTVAILLIAIIIYIVFNFSFKKIVAAVLLVLIPFVSFSYLFDRNIERMNIVKENALDFKFPPEYWLYMGLRNPGGFSNDDFEYIYQLEGYEARQAAGRAGIAQRLSDYGVIGFLDHLRQKSAFTFNDGTYFAGILLNREPVKQNRLQSFFLNEGEHYLVYFAVSNAYQYLILLLLIAGMVMGFKKRGFDIATLLYVALFGLTAFLMIWETRSRYLLNFTPIMLALAANNLVYTGDKITEILKKHRSSSKKEITSVQEVHNP